MIKSIAARDSTGLHKEEIDQVIEGDARSTAPCSNPLQPELDGAARDDIAVKHPSLAALGVLMQ